MRMERAGRLHRSLGRAVERVFRVGRRCCNRLPGRLLCVSKAVLDAGLRPKLTSLHAGLRLC